ncbi:hypothetical protein [Kerstersia gyiorum]|uniref:Uncharacterized protein n=1 Tax=Kerstersia gyiorum TaxID=206506 RepID=A0A171KRS7_9BURK|nr:hypothetical protein [Kerstersia gyiorum]KAB0542480.1 hypothetical protein F7P85_12780 [Kerstersia gyiorum]KKO71594.1 hypothetical protein AAV32_10390 [Kerstersia gyiorum]MCP1634292.1 hypothetical protein [Kerstersia gyiorum]MCP1638081.1 hypothetical protein [Kerstersia gyiorum]MCP1672515.1 hypothetical protein [Kerstersia gyiorum]
MTKQTNTNLYSDIRMTDSLERELLQRAMRDEIDAQRAEAMRATFRAISKGMNRAFKGVFNTIVEARKHQARAALRSTMARSANLHGKAV